MAIGIIATLKVKEGKGGDFEAGFKELAKAVRANEPGNTLYQLCKSRKDKDTYVVMEIYENDDAVKAHRNSDHFRTIGAGFASVLAGPPDVHVLDIV